MVKLLADGIAMNHTLAVWSVRVDDPSLCHHFCKVRLEVKLLHTLQDGNTVSMDAFLPLVVIFGQLLKSKLLGHLITGKKATILAHMGFLYLVVFRYHVGGTMNMDIICIDMNRPDGLTVCQVRMLSGDTGIFFVCFFVSPISPVVCLVQFLDGGIDKFVCHLQNLGLLFVGQLSWHRLKTKQCFPVLL